ncbi:MAG: 6-pyruvoyl trahydropterin synthase family protein [Flavobacteriales bacterium]
MRVKVRRKAHFNAAHRLYKREWSDEKNEAVFGKCSNPNYHGHNYNLEVEVEGEVDPEIGFVIDMKLLKKIIFEQVTSYLDHKNLNIQIEEFKELNPTAEFIAVVIWNRLRTHISAHLKMKVTLFETERNSVEYSGD